MTGRNRDQILRTEDMAAVDPGGDIWRNAAVCGRGVPVTVILNQADTRELRGKGHGGSEAAERKRGGSVSVFRENILEGERTMEYELILLAAGFSRRFGENKLLYPVEGVPMYLRAAKLLLRLKRQRQDIRGIRAVTRYPEIRRELRRRGIPTVRMNTAREEFPLP